MQTSMFAFFSLNNGVLPPRRCGARDGHNHPALLIVLHQSKGNPPHGKAKALHHPLIRWVIHLPADTARTPSAAMRLEWLKKPSLSISLIVTFTPYSETKNITPKDPPTFQVGWHLKQKHYSRFAPA